MGVRSDGEFIIRLRSYRKTNPACRFFLLPSGSTWIEDPELAELDRIPTDLQAYCVVYPNGQILAAEGAFSAFPQGVRGLQEGISQEPLSLKESDLVTGRKYIQVVHSGFRRNNQDDRVWTYRTTLRNLTNLYILVTAFGGFRRVGGVFSRKVYRLSTVTGRLYSHGEFCNWYGLEGLEGDALSPNSEVSDPHNYGGSVSGDTLWAYYCKAENGPEFVAGEIVKPPV